MNHCNFQHRNQRHNLTLLALLFALLALTWTIYQPAIPGFFLMDDFANLHVLKGGVNDTISLRNYLENANAGPLGRPISKLSFLINDNAWPSSPEGFKRTNLLIHLLIGLLLFLVARMLLRRSVSKTQQADWLAITITALWLVHPFQVSTVSYIVQRMTQLSSLFIVMGITTHLALRLRHPDIQTRQMVWLSASLGGFGLLAAFSKESGVLLPIYLMVVEFTLLAHLSVSKTFIWWRRIFIILPTASLIVYLAYLPIWVGSYATRNFTLAERLLTQPVILLDYLSHFVSLRVHGLGLFQDDHPIYSTLFEPPVLGSMVLLTTAFIAAVKYHKRYPLFAFGTLWFLGGHLLESTTVPLELYFEHRNYLPLFGPIFALTAAVYLGLKKISKNMDKFSSIFATIIIGIASLTTWGYATEWGNQIRLYTTWASEHPNSARAQRTLAQLLASKGYIDGALDGLDKAYKERFPHDLSLPIISTDISCRFKRPLRYDLNVLATTVSKHKITGGLRPAFESLFGNITTNSCRNRTAELHKLVPALFDLPENRLKKKIVASIFVLDGDLYMEERKGNDALRSYEVVEKLMPSKDSMLRLTDFFIIMGDFEPARKTLEIAQERETGSKRWHRRSRAKEYEEKFYLINRLQEKKNNSTATD